MNHQQSTPENKQNTHGSPEKWSSRKGDSGFGNYASTNKQIMIYMGVSKNRGTPKS